MCRLMQARGYGCIAGCALMVFAELPAAAVPISRQPNFVFILMDDMGWCDVGFMGMETVNSRKPNRIPEPRSNDRMMAAIAVSVRDSQTLNDARFSSREVNPFVRIAPDGSRPLRSLETQRIKRTSDEANFENRADGSKEPARIFLIAVESKFQLVDSTKRNF